MPLPLEMDPKMTSENPLLDYTEPQFVSLFVTDLGKMTPSVRHPSTVSPTELRIQFPKPRGCEILFRGMKLILSRYIQ